MAAMSTLPSPAIQNVVSTFDTGTRFDLGVMAIQCCFVQYQPRKFAAAVIRLAEPQTTCLLFESGKAVCTGAGSEQLSCVACLRFVLLLQKNGYPHTCFRDFSVQNIVAAVYCPFQLDLFKLADSVSGFCSYEPTLFPGLVYRVSLSKDHDIDLACDPVTNSARDSKKTTEFKCKRTRGNAEHLQNEIVFVCFQSGKCIVTGAKKRQDISDTWSSFYKDVLLSNVAKNHIGSSARCNIFDTVINASYEDDKCCFLKSIVASATGIIRSVAPIASQNVDILEFFESLHLACLHVDILELQGVQVEHFDHSSLDAGDKSAIELMRHIKNADLLSFDSWVVPEIKEAKRLQRHIHRLGMSDTSTENDVCAFQPYVSS
jgi:TATA-box binding protein (TBP) (component of TFIID and TFIIIB)